MGWGVCCPIKGKQLSGCWLINTCSFLGERTPEADGNQPSVSGLKKKNKNKKCCLYQQPATVSKHTSTSIIPAASLRRVNHNKNLFQYCLFFFFFLSLLRITEVEIFIVTQVAELQSLEGFFKFRPVSPETALALPL